MRRLQMNHQMTGMPHLIYKHILKTLYLIEERNAKQMHGVAATNNEGNNSLATAPVKYLVTCSYQLQTMTSISKTRTEFQYRCSSSLKYVVSCVWKVTSQWYI
jgi:hypothetical protein